MKIKKLTKKIIMDLDYNPKEIEMCLAWHPALGILEGARLESVFTGNRNDGLNPSLSAIN